MLKIAFLNAASELDSTQFPLGVCSILKLPLDRRSTYKMISCGYRLLVTEHTLWSELSTNDLLVGI